MLRDASRVVKQQQDSSSTAAAAAAAAAQQQHSSSSSSSSSSSGQLPFGVSGWLLCRASVAERVCALSVYVHPGCPSLLWLRGFGLGIKLGARRPIVWTAGARMNLERSSVQSFTHLGSYGPFFVKFVQFSSFGWIFWSEFGLEIFYRKHTS